MTSRFDGLDNDLLNLNDVIIKNLQVENERIRKWVNVLENKILIFESELNSLEQQGRNHWNSRKRSGSKFRGKSCEYF